MFTFTFDELQAQTPCPICRSRDAWCIARRDRDRRPLTTVLCRGCGHARTDPLPTREALQAFYRDRYRQEYKGVARPRPHHVLRAGRIAAGRLAQLAPLLDGAHEHLDVGASAGEFVALAAARGLKVLGLEPHAGYAAYARTTYGVPVVDGGVEQTDFEPGRFGSVSMFHVLEHLRDPVEGLRTLARWLRDDGLLYLEVPNLLDVEQAPFSRYHAAHLHHFTPATLTMAAAAAGFEPLRQWCSPDGGVLSLIARRSAKATVVTPSAAEVDTVRLVLAKHTPARHVARLRWPMRTWRRIAGGVRERRRAALLASHAEPAAWLVLRPSTAAT